MHQDEYNVELAIQQIGNPLWNRAQKILKMWRGMLRKEAFVSFIWATFLTLERSG